MQEKCNDVTTLELNVSKNDGLENLIDDYRKLMGNGLIEGFELFMNDNKESLKIERFKNSIKGSIELVANALMQEFGLENDHDESLEGEIARLSFLSSTKIRELWTDLTEQDPQPDAPMQELIEDIAHFTCYGEPVALSDNGRSIRSQHANDGDESA
jgi:hypothetical protein